MTRVNPLVIPVPSSVKDPALREYLRYLMKVIFDLRERTGGASDLGFGALSDPGSDRVAFWDESEDAVNWLAVSTGLNLTSTALTTKDSEINHNGLLNYSANRHIDHSAVTITAGNGLTGGGTITSSRTINIGGGTGITVNADSIETNDGEIDHDSLLNFFSAEHVDHTSVTLTAGTGLTGGGTIAASRTFAIDTSVVVTLTGTQTLTNKTLTSPSVSNDLTMTDGDVIFGDTSKGLDFSAQTGAAGVVSQKLTRVETGNWSPVLSDGTNDGTNSGAYGSYTRTEDSIKFRAEFTVSSKGSISGALRVKGLPVPSANVSGNSAIVNVAGAGLNLAAAGYSLFGYITANTDYIQLFVWDTASSGTALDASETGATPSFTITGEYKA